MGTENTTENTLYDIVQIYRVDSGPPKRTLNKHKETMEKLLFIMELVGEECVDHWNIHL